jgi:4-diphosphocytidyl-2-C-methyl-D-erythritol kinase
MVTIQAPAKINLHLEIRNRRNDGYHDLWSIFQSVSLFDTISVRSLKTNGICRLNGNFNFPNEENIITKAYKLYTSITGISAGIEVFVEKVIPIGAGLGGGSSDGAGMLRLLEAFFETPLDNEDVNRCAHELGSDVLYFLKAVSAVVSGRGNTVTPILPRSDYIIVIVFPGFEVETKKAYAWLDNHESLYGIERFSISEENLTKSYLSDCISDWRFGNSFCHVLKKRYQVYSEIFDQFKKLGALYFNISGSGSSVFGIFNNEENARTAAHQFLKTFVAVFRVRPLDKIPLPVLQ